MKTQRTMGLPHRYVTVCSRAARATSVPVEDVRGAERPGGQCYIPFMRVWIVHLEDTPGFIGVFDIEDDAYEFQDKYAADSGLPVLLTPVAVPYRATGLDAALYSE